MRVTGKAIVGSVLGVLVAVAAVYLAALGYLWATQRSHVFHPGDWAPRSHQFDCRLLYA